MQDIHLINKSIDILLKKPKGLSFDYEGVYWHSTKIDPHYYYLWIMLKGFSVNSCTPNKFDILFPISRFFGLGQPISVCFINKALCSKLRPVPFLSGLNNVNFNQYSDYYPMFLNDLHFSLQDWHYLCLWSRYPDDKSFIAVIEYAFNFLSNPFKSAMNNLLYWKNMLATGNDKPYYYTWIGYIFEQLGNYPKAELHFRKALSVNPRYSLAKNKLMKLQSINKAI